MRQILLSQSIELYPVGENIISYLHICKEIADIIKKEFPDKAITFWCSGSSGAIISALVSQHLEHVNIFHVKKSGERAHESYITTIHNTNIIIDDLICSGTTVEYIYDKMNHNYSILPDAIIMTGTIRTGRLKYLKKDVLLIAGYFEL